MVMAVSPILAVFGAVYHWYPKITGRMLNEGLGRFHFWVTFVGLYCLYYPMHYLGIMGVPRRYFSNTGVNGLPDWIPESAQFVNIWISIAAIVVASVQLLFLYNLYRSATHGKPAGGNPWGATTLEWQTSDTPPTHGNFGKELPSVYRWAYDFSVPGAEEDFIPQNVPASKNTGQAS
jgi:cytochrome c oxidase subunit 1